MSTENEGATVPPTAEPSPAPRAPHSAPTSGAANTASAHRAETPPLAPPPPPAGQPAAPGGPAAASGDGAGFATESASGQAPPAASDTAQSAAPTTPMASGGHETWPPPPSAQPGGPGGWGGGWGGGGGGWGGGPGPVPGGPRRKSGGVVAAVLVAALVAGGVGGGVGFWAADRDDGGSTTISSTGNSAQLNRAPESVAGIAKKALPSVVTIEAQGQTGDGGTGTGFVYDKQGHILTNNHVVASAAQGGNLTATFSDGKKYAAEVVGRAEGYDVAVIKLKDASGAKLEPLPLADSDKNVAVGDTTIAIGAPFGLAGTVTTGIVSAKNRPVASSDGGGSNASYMSALQTDASINPGNSGGPLLNADGAVIGINSAIQPGGGGGMGEQQSGSIGLGFAIPINQAKRVAQDLIKTGEPIYPVIGVQVDMREQSDGARITDTGEGGSAAVTKGGPADQAGLKPGDLITKLNDTVIDSGPTLISEIWAHKPEEKVKITYKRGGKESTVDVTLGQRKGDS
ncbi:S1C family serine protease [Streptomyces sp. TP-A0874]|uniref:S1C family serine protease n=1 Tax=Streptomyces sp. TP-A0874 TaxID=549819 RepID=UPI0008533A76|nr:trypsin-like peptidase domain-containing protein [Streptomyces sp. TP-A0874]